MRAAYTVGRSRLLATGSRVSGQYAYLRGAVTNLANPKSVTFVVALLPQFVDHGMGHIPLQFAVLGAIFIAFEVLVDGTVGLASGRIGSWLSRRRARQALDAGSGTIMVALAGRRPSPPWPVRAMTCHWADAVGILMDTVARWLPRPGVLSASPSWCLRWMPGDAPGLSAR